MFGNCDQMVAIPPTSNQWPQNQIHDHRKVSMMEKQGQEELQQQQQQQQQALKCPRCDSSNTKFCYYNNYSLSQPRHFCKACKRYWTRGGTLRNVPVGGGCRRNKRGGVIKKPTSSSSTNIDTSSSPPSASNNVSQPQSQIDAASTSNHMISPVFYGCDVNLPFSRLFNNNSRISSSTSGYDIQPMQMNNGTVLGFSSGFMSNEASHENGYRNGFTSNNNTLVSSYGSIFRSSSSSSTSASSPSTMPTSLLSSNHLLQHKFTNHGGPDTTLQGLALAPLEQMVGLKDYMKGEGEKRLEWNGAACQNQIEHHVGGNLFDPNSLYWNTAYSAMGVWNDQPNIGPSVTSLI